MTADASGLPIRMLHDRLLVSNEDEGERRSGGGILIPPTVQLGRRLMWARVAAVGGAVRSVAAGERVLYDPHDKPEVELQGHSYVLLRERDVHAVAAETGGDDHTGLYL